MSAATAREALERALGPAGGNWDEACDRSIDAVKPWGTLRPVHREALATALRLSSERGLATLVLGGGSHAGLGNPPRAGDLLLSTAALTGIDELDADEGVVYARAGTPLHELREAAEAAGWELPFDPPGPGATLGGTLAADAFGPRLLGFGRCRDSTLGLDVVLGDGCATRCGGRVVKNVTGYDLMKLQIGALGTLGVIAGAWVRLRPAPQAVCVLTFQLGDERRDLEAALAVARQASARAVALVDAHLAAAVDPLRSPAAGFLLVAELAGDEVVVERDAAHLRREFDAESARPGALERLRALQGEAFGTSGLRFRVAALPSKLPEVLGRLGQSGGALLAYPGGGIVFARYTAALEGDAASVEELWREVGAAARAGVGHARLEAAPTWAKAVRDVFGDPGEGESLQRALKQRFDPAGILNPGRFAGGL